MLFNTRVSYLSNTSSSASNLPLFFWPRSPQSKEHRCRKWALPPSHIYTHTNWNLSHRKWSCAASCQARQIIHHLKNALFSPPQYSLLPLSSLLVFFTLAIVFISFSPESDSQRRQKAWLPALSQTELQKWAKWAAAVVTQGWNSQKYPPVVFP